MKDKKTLRKYFSEIRKDIPKKSEKDNIITRKLLECDEIKNADTVLVFSSFGTEFSTAVLIDTLLKKYNEKSSPEIGFPLCEKEGIMTFRKITDISQLRSGAYGISEPETDAPFVSILGKTVCIVPGLAFTLSGGRLGYGGGYYDRFLSEHKDIFTIAPVYEALIADELPLAEHDLMINKLVTEERMVLL